MATFNTSQHLKYGLAYQRRGKEQLQVPSTHLGYKAPDILNKRNSRVEMLFLIGEISEAVRYLKRIQGGGISISNLLFEPILLNTQDDTSHYKELSNSKYRLPSPPQHLLLDSLAVIWISAPSHKL